MILLEDTSFEEYANYLSENRDSIRELLFLSEDSPVRKLYQDVFMENFIEMSRNQECTMNVAATDSSEFIRELYNGRKLILARAFTRFNEHVDTKFVSRVMAVNRDEMSTFMGMLMEHLEHLSVIEILKNEHPDVVLIDGSLTGRLAHRKTRLAAEGYEDFTGEYFSVLVRLFDVSSESGIPLVFIAKSSETTILRRHLSSLIGKSSETNERVTDHLLVKSMATATGYTVPVRGTYNVGDSGATTTVSTSHFMPDLTDVPFKVDYVHTPDDTNGGLPEDIVRMLFFGYTGYKVYNLWLSDVDNLVKFRKAEMENIFMKEFERCIGIQFYETRGERRVRTRI